MKNSAFHTEKRSNFDGQFATDFKTPLPDRKNGKPLRTVNNMKEIFRRMGVYFNFTSERPSSAVMYFVGLTGNNNKDREIIDFIYGYAIEFGLFKNGSIYDGPWRRLRRSFDCLMTMTQLSVLDECFELESHE